MNKEMFNELKSNLKLSITKKDGSFRSVSVAVSLSGEKYFGGLVESDTNTFNLPSEHIALMLSTISNDYRVNEIVTLTEETDHYTLPIILKIIIDHSIRTGQLIKYTLIDTKGDIIFKQENVSLDFYKPKNILLSKINQNHSPYHKKLNLDQNKNLVDEIKKYAIEGLVKNFPLYDSASGYATSVVTEKNEIFFAGQYSSPDKRLGLHSEVNSILSSLMYNKDKITHIGLVSNKYKNEPCQMCGNCRQFISEICSKFNFDPKIYLFAKDKDIYIKQNINNYLPSKWTSKNW